MASHARGRTDLGEYALRGMMKRNMIVEIDHQSAKAAKRTMEILESEGYPGVVSTHSWMDKHFTERLYRLGGFITHYGHDADTFVSEGTQERALREKYALRPDPEHPTGDALRHLDPRGEDLQLTLVLAPRPRRSRCEGRPRPEPRDLLRLRWLA